MYILHLDNGITTRAIYLLSSYFGKERNMQIGFESESIQFNLRRIASEFLEYIFVPINQSL